MQQQLLGDYRMHLGLTDAAGWTRQIPRQKDALSRNRRAVQLLAFVRFLNKSPNFLQERDDYLFSAPQRVSRKSSLSLVERLFGAQRFVAGRALLAAGMT